MTFALDDVAMHKLGPPMDVVPNALCGLSFYIERGGPGCIPHPLPSPPLINCDPTLKPKH